MKTKTFYFLLILISIINSSCDPECGKDGYRDRFYSAEQWFGNLQTIIPFGSIRLNNYTPTGGQFCQYSPTSECDGTDHGVTNFCSGSEFQFKKPCDSEINFVVGRRIFDISVTRVGPNAMYKVYLNDIYSNNLEVRVENNKLNFAVDFESNDTEIKINCYNNLACGLGSPQFELNNMHFDILFQISSDGENITYDRVDVEVNADFQNSGLCKDNIFAILCGDQREVIFSNLKEQVERNLLRNDIKSFISNSLNNYIRTTLNLGNKKIRNAAILGNSLYLNLEC